MKGKSRTNWRARLRPARWLPWTSVFVALPVMYAVMALVSGTSPGPLPALAYSALCAVTALVYYGLAPEPGASIEPSRRRMAAEEPELLSILREPLHDLGEFTSGAVVSGVRREPGRAVRALGSAISALAANDTGDLALSPVDPRRLLEDALQDWSACADARERQFHGFVSPALPCRVFGDERRLRRVVDLMLFAGCYAGRGGVLEFAAEWGPGGQPGLVRLCLDSRGSGEQGGVGEVALQALRHLVHRLGGRSVERAGSPRWRVDLPVDVDAEQDDSEPAKALSDLRAHVRGESLLSGTLRSYLEADGARLEVNPEQADVILLAESSRHGHAEQLSQELKEQYPRIPLLCQAGGGELAGVLVDADGLLPLPLTRETLRQRIRAVLPVGGAARSRSESHTATEPTAEEAPPARTDAQVLVAEDDAISARVVCRFLELEGVQVIRVADGQAALRQLEGGSVKLALLDMNMPRVDGLEVARRQRVREKQVGGNRVTLVALTASTANEDRRACEAAGMDGFLTKPVERRALREFLQGIEVGN